MSQELGWLGVDGYGMAMGIFVPIASHSFLFRVWQDRDVSEMFLTRFLRIVSSFENSLVHSLASLS